MRMVAKETTSSSPVPPVLSRLVEFRVIPPR